MKTGCHKISGAWGALVIASIFSLSAALAALQTVSLRNPGSEPPAGGSGDSTCTIISPDGRYVLFASTANNLVLTSSNRPIPALFPPNLNVFLRDRTSGKTILVSANTTGTAGGDGDSFPAGISTNGQYVLFESAASNLFANDTNNTTDVFVRDLANEATILVSASTNGGVGNGDCGYSVMTPDGRYVAFASAANNHVPGDTNGIPDVFVRDLQTESTLLVSAGAIGRTVGASLPGSTSEAPAITPDGRHVAFYSTATNLVPGATNASDIYVRDLVSGITIWASESARAAAQSAQLGTSIISHNHAISDDGQFVAFAVSPWWTSGPQLPNRGLVLRYNTTSGLTNLVHTNVPVSLGPEDMLSLDMSSDGRFIAFVANTNLTTGVTTCILVWDAQSGVTTLASGTLSNTVPANSICQWPQLDPTGRFVAFLSSATNLTTNTLVGEYHLYVRDLQSGATVLVDEDGIGFGSGVSPGTTPNLTEDGRFVAFECADSDLVNHDRNHSIDVFVRVLGSKVTELISARHPALPSATPNGLSSASGFSLNSDGRFAAFMSDADNIVANDTNQSRDVFVRDLVAGTNLLVSAAADGFPSGIGFSSDPAISGDGRYVAFSSGAHDLVAGDTNNMQDVFVRDLQTGATILASVSINGFSAGNQVSHSPAINANGRYVLFRSRASNLGPAGFPFSNENVFMRDIEGGVTHALTRSGATAAAMTGDGRFVAFGGRTGNAYVWDSQSVTGVHTNATTVVTNIAISPDGNRLVYAKAGGLFAADRIAKTNWLIAPGLSGSRPGLRFSGDERFLAYANKAASVSMDTNGTYDVYLYDFETGANLLVSRGYDSSAALGGVSDGPDISSDGRFVSYRSAATNIVPNDSNGVPDIFLYDRLTGINTLLSKSRFGNSSADSRSLAPVFSGNGRVLLFQSWASDLVALDFNHNGDVFAFWLPFAETVPGDIPGEGPTLFWPATPGRTYRAQYKDNLSDTAWQDVNGTVTISGNTATVTDLAPSLSQRFYRVLTD